MAKPTTDGLSPLAHDAAESAAVLSEPQARYLQTVRKLFVAYPHTRGAKQRQIFLRMIHAFMQDLCGYPRTSYSVTTAASGNAAVGSYPHVIPTASVANPTLFYFTASDNTDNVQDLWVRQAQVYLIAPQTGDTVAEYATAVVFSNFFVLDGARKDPKTGAWDLWSAADIAGAQIARVDLRSLGYDTAPTGMTSRVIQQRLQMLQYLPPSNARTSNSHGSEARAEGMPAARKESRGA